MKEFEQKREKIADVLETVGAIIMIVVGVIFAGWAAYSLYGYINLHGFEWKQFLPLLSKGKIVDVVIRFLCTTQWIGLLLCIGWATLMMGSIIRQMTPNQGKKKRVVLLLRLSMMLLSIAMCVVLLIMGKTGLLYVPFIPCLIGSFGNSDDDDDQKAKELEEKTNELEHLRQRVEELEKKLAETATQEQETENDNQF